MADTIECPNCHYNFPPAEAIAKQVRIELDDQLAREKLALRNDYEARIKADRERIESDATARANSVSDLQLVELRQSLKEKDESLKKSREQEIELRHAQRKLEQERQDLELDVQRRLDTERVRIQDEIAQRSAHEYSLKEKEWEQQHRAMTQQIEELRRRAEQGSQQVQGETFELEIEDFLRETFLTDTIEPVAKGVIGCDILQHVYSRTGNLAGTIALELKRTKAWSDGWIQKLKDDARARKAHTAVIVSIVMPDNVKRIGYIDGVWVVDFQSLLGLLTALRISMLDLAQARAAQTGKKEKMEILYDYLSCQDFRARVAAIAETFMAMRDDLESEKRAFEKIWAKRDKQIARIAQSTAAMYGDLHGIIGASLPEIAALELNPIPALEAR